MKKFILFVVIFLSSNLHADALKSKLKLVSTVLSENRDITVYLPKSYHTESSKYYPVMYLLDGEINGELVASMLQRMHLSEGSYEHIVVAIHSTDRLRDYAPTINKDPRGPLGKGGGAEKFLTFLKTELMTKINGTFRTSSHNVIAGHSIAGLLVLHSFHAHPQLFQAYLAFSPAVWWAERETLKATQNYVLSDRVISSYLYMNIGSEAGEMREVYDSLADTLSRNRTVDLSFKTETFEHDGHGLTLAAGLYNGLSGLYKYQQSQNIK